jgi:hypothetical protein
MLSEVTDAFSNNPAFTEFMNYANINPLIFHQELTAAVFLSVAQQIVQAHVNMGLPAGEFYSLASTKLPVPNSIAAFARQFGELPLEGLGKRFILADYHTTVSSLVMAASYALACTKEKPELAPSYLWLPTSRRDPRTVWCIAVGMSKWLKEHAGAEVETQTLADLLFTGVAVPTWLRTLFRLGGRENTFNPFFTQLADEQAWRNFINARSVEFQLLDLSAEGLKVTNLDFDFDVQSSFPLLARRWLRRVPAIERFFHCASILDEASSSQGSMAQFSEVEVTRGITQVTCLSALEPNQFSLLVCLPPKALIDPSTEFLVTVTTSAGTFGALNAFFQQDWKSGG